MEWRAALSSRDQLVALQNELDIASQMQQSILPTVFPQSDAYGIFANMEPARNVGGDFFDVMRLDNGRIGFAIADVSDKGVPAALMMMSCRTLLKGAAIGNGGPGEVLAEVNNLLLEGNETAMFVTVFYVAYDPATGRFTYANGGHNPPLVVHADGSSETLPLTGGVALGLVPGLEYEQQMAALAPGDTLFLYTDGVTEAMNGDSEEFGLDRLQAVFAATPPEDAQQVNEEVFRGGARFRRRPGAVGRYYLSNALPHGGGFVTELLSPEHDHERVRSGCHHRRGGSDGGARELASRTGVQG